MNFTKIALLATAGAALVMSPAYAKPHNGHGDSQNDRGDHHADRDWQHGYSDSGWNPPGLNGNTPPGLAKKPYGMPPGQAKKLNRYTVGQHLPRTYYREDDYYITNPGAYDLRVAPPGYQWVRVGNDVYLAQTRTGLIADIVAGLFH